MEGCWPCPAEFGNSIAGKAVTLISKYSSVKVFGAVCAPHDLLSGGGVGAGDGEVQGGIHELQLWRDPGPCRFTEGAPWGYPAEITVS